MRAMDCRRFDDDLHAFGLAVHLLRRVEPFSGYQFGRFANVLMGQIRRKHYVFAMSAGAPVGYVGWAMCSEENARAWIARESVPTFEECLRGDCWVGITYYAANARACWALARHCRARYPGAKAFGIREYRAGHRTLALTNMTQGEPAAQTAA